MPLTSATHDATWASDRTLVEVWEGNRASFSNCGEQVCFEVFAMTLRLNFG